MDYLIELGKRLESIKTTRDPDEAKALHEWIDKDGLNSLKETTSEELLVISVEKHQPLTFTIQMNNLKAAPFDMQVYPYTKVSEILDTVAVQFDLPRDQIACMWAGFNQKLKAFELLDVKLVSSQLKALMGNDTSPLMIVPTANATWLKDEEGRFTITTAVIYIDHHGDMVGKHIKYLKTRTSDSPDIVWINIMSNKIQNGAIQTISSIFGPVYRGDYMFRDGYTNPYMNGKEGSRYDSVWESWKESGFAIPVFYVAKDL